MGNSIGSPARLQHIRDRVLQNMLPSVCQIYKRDRTVGSDATYYDSLGEQLEWRGETDIPCRVDISKSVRDLTVYSQSTVIDELELLLPYDAPLRADTSIIVRGRPFKVVKLFDLVDYLPTKTAVISEVLFGNETQTFAIFDIETSLLGLVATFTVNYEGGDPPFNFTWVFGDGTGGSGETVEHTYTQAGIYQIVLTVADSSGNSITTGKTIVVIA